MAAIDKKGITNKLSIQGTLNGTESFLDEKKLKDVLSFELAADAEDSGYAILEMTLRVKLWP